MSEQELIEIVTSTGEIYGRTVSAAAAKMFLKDLSGFSREAIVRSLEKCRKELRTFPTVADVVARIDDGRPGVEEAWSALPLDESQSVVWTEEMSEAFGCIRGILDDRVGARMAFKEIYSKLVAEARSRGKPPKWVASLGFDRHGRNAAIREAVDKKRITLEHAYRIDPTFQLPPGSANKLGVDARHLLPEVPK